jgi:hypothetical protein
VYKKAPPVGDADLSVLGLTGSRGEATCAVPRLALSSFFILPFGTVFNRAAAVLQLFRTGSKAVIARKQEL